MNETNDPEDRLIRMILIGGSSALVLGVLVVALVITVLISTNFNVLGWME